MRPIVSCLGTYTYNLAKFLVEILQPLCDSTYTVQDSFTFAKGIQSIDAPFMVSFDVSSLFTNVPLQETIDICLDQLFVATETVHGLTRDQLKKLLTVASKENHFLFNGMVFDQTDRVAMGSPLGPVLANIFMSNLEANALDKYQGHKPIIYHRYVDDTFLVFSSRDEVSQFFDWMKVHLGGRTG